MVSYKIGDNDWKNKSNNKKNNKKQNKTKTTETEIYFASSNIYMQIFYENLEKNTLQSSTKNK